MNPLFGLDDAQTGTRGGGSGDVVGHTNDAVVAHDGRRAGCKQVNAKSYRILSFFRYIRSKRALAFAPSP
jgi:hypothetical protein